MLCIIRSDKCTLMYIHLVFLDAFPYLLHVTTHCQDTDHIPKHTIFMNKLYVKGHYRSLNKEEKEEYGYWARQSMEARKVRQIVISLAGTRKEDHPQMMDAWILVKTWWAILWRGQLHLKSGWNTKLDQSLSNVLQGIFITSDRAYGWRKLN